MKMARNADDPYEFEESTNVIEGEVLQALAQRSTKPTGALQMLQPVSDELEVDVTIESSLPPEPLPPPPARASPPPPPLMPKPTPTPTPVPTSTPTTTAKVATRSADTDATEMVPMPPRRSPIMTGALIVAALVLAADFWFFVIHRRPPRPVDVHAGVLRPSLPTYVVLPATAPPVHPVLPDAPSDTASPVAAAAPPVAEVAVAMGSPVGAQPDPVAVSERHSRHHSHHHHSRSSH
jgi:hypothetical protein